MNSFIKFLFSAPGAFNTLSERYRIFPEKKAFQPLLVPVRNTFINNSKKVI